MNRQQLPPRAVDPEIPARQAEIRLPARTEAHDRRNDREADA